MSIPHKKKLSFLEMQSLSLSTEWILYSQTTFFTASLQGSHEKFVTFTKFASITRPS